MEITNKTPPDKAIDPRLKLKLKLTEDQQEKTSTEAFNTHYSPLNKKILEKEKRAIKVQEILDECPTGDELLDPDPTRRKEIQLKIRDIYNRLSNDSDAAAYFYEKTTDPNVLSVLPEWLETWATPIRLLSKNIFEEQTAGENIKPPLTNKDFRTTELEELRNILANKKLQSMSPEQQAMETALLKKPSVSPNKEIWFATPAGRDAYNQALAKANKNKDNWSYTDLGNQPNVAVSQALKKSLGHIWYKTNADGSFDVEDIYDFDPKGETASHVATTLGASSEEKKPGFSGGNRVKLKLEAPLVSHIREEYKD